MDFPEFEFDQLIVAFDNSLRTVFAPARAARSNPAASLAGGELSEAEQREAESLMRVNHVGEVCAQALYQGQALTARNPEARVALEEAAREETDHLAWCEDRLNELGGRKSLLNPLWYAGSFALGAAAGVLGDKWNLGFLAETERQVEAHLDEHLKQLPGHDAKSRAIVAQMKEDEIRHAEMAVHHGAAELPLPVKFAMRGMSMVMKRIAHHV
jgi:ubiquinone biosynthesis monooxygenase Coq7